MSSLKRSKYWSTNYVFAQAQQHVLTNQYVIAEEQQYVLVNQYVIQNRQQYAIKFNMIYNTYWNSYRIVQGVHFPYETTRAVKSY